MIRLASLLHCVEKGLGDEVCDFACALYLLPFPWQMLHNDRMLGLPFAHKNRLSS